MSLLDKNTTYYIDWRPQHYIFCCTVTIKYIESARENTKYLVYIEVLKTEYCCIVSCKTAFGENCV